MVSPRRRSSRRKSVAVDGSKSFVFSSDVSLFRVYSCFLWIMMVENNQLISNFKNMEKIETPTLFWLRSWFIKIFGAVKVREEKRRGWSGNLSIYRFFCNSCKKFGEDYPHGHEGRLDCPNCSLPVYYLFKRPSEFIEAILFLLEEKKKK